MQGVRELLEQGHIGNGFKIETISLSLLYYISIVVVTFGVISMIGLFSVYISLKDFMLSILIENKPSEISVSEFAQKIKLQAE